MTHTKSSLRRALAQERRPLSEQLDKMRSARRHGGFKRESQKSDFRKKDRDKRGRSHKKSRHRFDRKFRDRKSRRIYDRGFIGYSGGLYGFYDNFFDNLGLEAAYLASPRACYNKCSETCFRECTNAGGRAFECRPNCKKICAEKCNFKGSLF
jgi:hypothetical protein